MISQNKTWDCVKAEYLRQVEKALSSVKHPRSKEVLDDVRCHLDKRFAELETAQQSWENFQKIITEMGPPSDYAELLDLHAARPGPGVGRKYLLWFGLAAIVIIGGAIVLSTMISPKVGYIMSFKPVEPFAPRTPKELLSAFNKNHPRGVRTHHFRTRIRGHRLEGLICVDNKAAKDAIVNMIDKSEKLTLIAVRAVTQKELESHYRLGQLSLKGKRSGKSSSNRESSYRPEAWDERKLLRTLEGVLEIWLKDGSEVDGKKCDAIIEEILKQRPLSAETYFAAVRTARLRGQPQKAIRVLKRALATCPSGKAPGLNLPVGVVAYCQIGTIARNSGNAEEATKAYESAMKNTKGIEAEEFFRASCSIYLAEIASEILKDKQLAVKRLEAAIATIDAADINKMSSDWVELWPILRDWVTWKYEKLKSGKAPLSSSSKYSEAQLEALLGLAMIQMSLGGLEHRILLERAAQSDRSAVDRRLAKLALAFSYMHGGKNLEAKKYLTELAKGDSYFAPLAKKILGMIETQ